jgi:hypothetical protein
VPAGDGSLAVGVGAALVWVGAVASRLSMEVPIAPFPDEGDVPPDEEETGGGGACGVGDARADTGEPPPE